ncbi:Dps family protein [Hansschlegelia beijingensis]|uniref:Starvation-inducible DNA-binding protein n=1 Tax=Hansschlegelia beijingensis TaxID=1133344 RepID=A0A7W6CUU6_9HYPH|nr:DNA starvation/stationary phase protection protein [Hansschlegelia beijingensis]MBB3971515.1 starvation-inducible DNA-binding protein [Hansschlegelia beijingensis]
MSKAGVVLEVRTRAEKPNNGLRDADRKLIAETLSELTVQTYRTLLRSQVVHWNVVGPLFQPIHALTEQHYSDLFAAIDLLAERIRALGYPVPTGKAALGLDKALSLGSQLTAKAMVEELVEDHEALVRLVREGAAQAEEVNDFVTHDLLTERLAFHEKAIWMLRAIVAD